MDVLDRIRKLLALTASPNENEARTAAFQMARMIREHQIVLALPAVHSQASRNDEELWEAFRKAASWPPRQHRPQAKPETPPQAKPETPPAPATPPRKKQPEDHGDVAARARAWCERNGIYTKQRTTHSVADDEDTVSMKAKFAGRCVVCGTRFGAGEEIVWDPRTGNTAHQCCDWGL